LGPPVSTVYYSLKGLGGSTYFGGLWTDTQLGGQPEDFLVVRRELVPRLLQSSSLG